MKFRQDNVMITVETESAVIEFDDILEACEVVPSDCEKPWQDCDGYNHTVSRIAHSYQENANGCCLINRQCRLVELEYDHDLYNWYRRNGASKQTARERTAQSMRQRQSQLAKWLSEGWECVGVVCDFKSCQHSLWGIIDPDHAYLDWEKANVAAEVAAELEQQGYTVNGKPTKEDYRREYLANCRERYRHNVEMF